MQLSGMPVEAEARRMLEFAATDAHTREVHIEPPA
jgi:hypothetical protein